MSRSFFFILTILVMNFGYTLTSNAQNNNLIAQIDIYRAIVNGENVGQISIDNNHCFQFYRQGGNLMFANNYTRLNSKSYGPITNIGYKRNKEKDQSFSDIYQFVWNWKNTFDDETGAANVYVKVVANNEGTVARIVVVDENIEDVLEYGGILSHGSLNSIR